MSNLWQNMALWQRLAVSVVAIAALVGGALAWGARSGGRDAAEPLAGDVSPGAMCPAGPSSGDMAPEAPDLAPANVARAPSGKTELATFGLG